MASSAKRPLPTRAPVHPIGELRRNIGNQAMQRLLRSGVLHAKLTINQPGDQYEQEADRVAGHVIRSTGNPALQGKCGCGGMSGAEGECAECRKEGLSLQRRSGNEAEFSGVPPIMHEVLRSPGQPLDPATRAYMEPRFGHDFSQVRVHTDAKAAESARVVNALAYTVGTDLVFRAGQYAPATVTGKRLLAHELTHVLQQRGFAGTLNPSAGVNRPGDAAEVEAETTACQVMQGAPAQAISVVRAVAVQRADAGGDEEPPGPTLTRNEEIKLSRTSPGKVTGTVNPVMLSLYNFAISGATLKPRHNDALAELGDLMKRAKPSSPRVLAVGHADPTGEPVINDPLSRHRAESVQRVLNRVAGTTIEIDWAGERQPCASNDTVEGRSRNRRVDIHFLPGPGEKKLPKKEKKDEEEEDDTWFCREHPIICLAIAVGAIALWYCLTHPWRCLPIPKEKPGKKRACSKSVKLPSGEHRAELKGPVLGDQYWLKWPFPFDMAITFVNDDSGCDCSCGEYQHEVRGYSERDSGTGRMVRDTKIQLVGGFMDEEKYREDAREQNPSLPYGHRYYDDNTRLLLRPNREEDRFLFERTTGCRYVGSDEPGMKSRTRGEHLRFRFEFQGAAVDACHDRNRIGDWQTWVVWGDYTLPPPTTLPTVTLPEHIRADPTPTGAPDRIPPRVDKAVPVEINGRTETMRPVSLKIEGAGGKNGNATINGRSIVDLNESSTVKLRGTRQTEPYYDGNLRLVAYLGKTRLAETEGFSVAAYPVRIGFTFKEPLSPLIFAGKKYWGASYKFNFDSDSGHPKDCDKTSISENIFGFEATGLFKDITPITSGFFGTTEAQIDRHVFGGHSNAAALHRKMDQQDLTNSKAVVNQLFRFACWRTSIEEDRARGPKVPVSGFQITTTASKAHNKYYIHTKKEGFANNGVEAGNVDDTSIIVAEVKD